MTIFRFSVLALSLFAASAAAPSQSTTDTKLGLAAKAVLGRLEVRQRNVPGRGETTVTKAVRLLELSFGPVLITEVTVQGGSHAEVGALGVYYLKRVGNHYALVKSWPEIVEGGGFGQPPEWSMTNRFTTSPAIFATAGWTGQGCTSSWASLAELAPSGPVVSDAIHTDFSFDRGDAGANEELNGRIANIRKANSFAVIATGTDRFVEHYVFRHGRFVRVEKESRLQC